MSRIFVTLFFGLLTAFFSVGFAEKAQAAVTINSITGVPNPVPAAGAFAPVLIDCGGVNAVPTGNAILTNAATGQVVSQNAVAYYQDDSSGNPIVYAYVVFPVNHNPSQSITYTLTITVNGSDGSTASRMMSLVQGLKAPITINSITPTPASLASTTTVVNVHVDMTANGTNQAGYQSGYVQVADSSGNLLDLQAFQGAPTSDGQGGMIYAPYPLHVPANTTTNSITYTLTAGAKDNTGVWAYSSVPLIQLAGTAAPSATALSVGSVSGTAGQSVTLSATLSSGGASVSGRSLSFSVDSSAVGSATTTGSGVASLSYALPAGAFVGSHSVTVSFAGDASYAAASGSGTLTAAAATPISPVSLLWTSQTGQVSLWHVQGNGSSSYQAFGPYSGWTASSVSDSPDGTTHILWSHTDGQVSLWNVSASSITSQQYGPYTWWSAGSLATGGDGVTHLLWNRTDGLASLWAISASGATPTHVEYGPFAGWTANAVAAGQDGTDLLWTNRVGMMSGWTIAANGSVAHSESGPYPQWTTTALSVGPDDAAHLLWDNTSGLAALWNVDFASGNFTQALYGPFGGWSAAAIATGSDAVTHVLWNHTADGQVSLWNVGSSGATHQEYGPYAGWTAVALSAAP